MSAKKFVFDEFDVRKTIPNILLSLFVLMLLFTPPVAAKQAALEKPIWLVVTRPTFQEAIKPLAEKRGKEGFETVVSTKHINEVIGTLKCRPAFLLLVGDDQPGEDKQPWYVPSQRRQLYRWRAPQGKEFASDTILGDFDGDLIPDIPVGRIPVRTAEQLKLVVTKILAFENKHPTLDDLRLPIWAGSAGYNQMFNYMATELLLNGVQKNASPWLRPWIISADLMHSLCGWPPDQAEMFTEQLKRGGVMAVLIGHGSADSFYSMSFNGQNIGYAAVHAQKALAAGEPVPPLVIIACSTGSFTGRENCLAESLLLMPAGPVAVIGATTESHPLPNYFSSLCLVQERGEKDKRLGSLWLAAQQNAMKTRDFIIERMLCDVEGSLEEKINIANLRRDQILMYALLGDPATRLHLPDRLVARLERDANQWQWDVDRPAGATRLYVDLRPDGQSFPKVEGQLEKVSALKLFQQADSTFAFKSLGEFGIDQAWRGVVSEEGTLRLVATGPGRFYVTTFMLEHFNILCSDIHRIQTSLLHR